jgi:hypothetical protein
LQRIAAALVISNRYSIQGRTAMKLRRKVSLLVADALLGGR